MLKSKAILKIEFNLKKTKKVINLKFYLKGMLIIKI